MINVIKQKFQRRGHQCKMEKYLLGCDHHACQDWQKVELVQIVSAIINKEVKIDLTFDCSSGVCDQVRCYFQNPPMAVEME